MATKLSDKSWKALAKKNAEHSAHLHLEVGNAAKVAEALKDTPVLEALEFLFHQAEKHRKTKQFKKVATLLEAATLIDRVTGEETDIELSIDARKKEEQTKLYVHRHTPRSIFESEL